MYTKEEIAHKVMNDDAWTVRALLALYERQTTDEQDSASTFHDNGVGFCSNDGHWLSKMAESAKRRGFLTPKQLHTVRYHRSGKPRIAKYAGQLLDIAKKKAAAQRRAKLALLRSRASQTLSAYQQHVGTPPKQRQLALC